MFPQKDDPLFLLIDAMLYQEEGKSPSLAIEQSEKRGQSILVQSEVLPKKCNYGTREQFENMGIIFKEDADDLFVYVTLPDGWRKEKTDHAMWSKLIDNNGRERASIFYKAAFYDREAFLNIERRYRVSSYESSDKDGNIVSGEVATHFATYILDAGKPIKLIAVRLKEYKGDEVYKNERDAIAWLSENYPDSDNPLAYW